MIQYACAKCGAMLESPRSLAGQQDKCPLCGHVCIVPSAKPRVALILGLAGLCAVLVAAAAIVLWFSLRGRETGQVASYSSGLTQIAESPRVSEDPPAPRAPQPPSPSPVAPPPPKEADWRRDLNQFSIELAAIVREAKIPTESELMNQFREKIVFTGKDGRPMYVIDETPSDPLQSQLSKKFHGAEVEWTGTVTNWGEVRKTGEILLWVKIPDVNGLPKGASLTDVLIYLPKDSLRFKDFSGGEIVSFTAKLERKKSASVHNLNVPEGVDPVHPFFGVGQERGKVEFEVGPIDAQSIKIVSKGKNK